jgi:hypothetical protein
MTIYDDLREQYAQWTQEDLDYWRSSGRFAEHFATGFKEYIGAPSIIETLRREIDYLTSSYVPWKTTIPLPGARGSDLPSFTML